MIPPVLLLIYNRPHLTARVFEAIRAARPTRLYVAADGPRGERAGEAERCAEARRVATAVDWPCEVRLRFLEQNLGCRRAVGEAITWFFQWEPEGIILEDDCLPDASFFPFCAELLARYRQEPRVMCITGNNFQRDMGDWPYSYYFSIYNHCWGWASWRRAWELFDAQLNTFQARQARRRLRQLSGVPGFASYFSRQLTEVAAGRLDSWAYAWTWSCWYRGGLTCTPRVNLVSNIGFGDDATHTRARVEGDEFPVRRRIEFPLCHPATLTAVAGFDDFVSRNYFHVGESTPLRRASRFARQVVHQVARTLRGR